MQVTAWGMLARAGVVCEYWSTRGGCEVREGVTVVGDGTEWITVGEAAAILGGVHTETVRRYADDHLVRSYRMAKGHRRIDAASARALAEALRMPLGPERDAALDALRQSNRAKMQSGPAQ